MNNGVLCPDCQKKMVFEYSRKHVNYFYCPHCDEYKEEDDTPKDPKKMKKIHEIRE